MIIYRLKFANQQECESVISSSDCVACAIIGLIAIYDEGNIIGYETGYHADIMCNEPDEVLQPYAVTGIKTPVHSFAGVPDEWYYN